MAKLLIEIELSDKDVPVELDHFGIEQLWDDMAMCYVECEWKAIVMDDQGEIIRESE